MKTTAIITLIVIAFLAVCIGWANSKRNAEVKALLKPQFAGNTWQYTQDHYDQGLQRYTIRIRSSKRLNDQDAKQLAEYTRDTHDKSGKQIIFFEQLNRQGAYLRVDYPSGSFEKLEDFER